MERLPSFCESVACSRKAARSLLTRFGPNRPAADMMEMEYLFFGDLGEFLRISEDGYDLIFEICGPNHI